MTWLLRLLLVSLLAVPVLVTSAAPAQACSCASTTPRETAREAVDVFVATLVEDPSEAEPGILEARPEISHVYKGSADGEVRVATHSEQSLCGKSGLEAGETRLIYGTVTDGVVRVGSCSGSPPADERSLAEAERLLGPAREVDPGGPTLDELTADNGPAGDQHYVMPPWAWGVGGAFVVLVAVALVARLSARDTRR
jgi:hypothetical protein